MKKKKKNIMILVIILIVVILIGSAILIQCKKIKEAEYTQKKEEYVEKRLKELGISKYNNIQVFLKDIEKDQIEKIQEEICKINNVKNTEIITKEDALEKLKEKLKGNEELLEGYEGDNNIFPNSIIVEIKDFEKTKETIEEIEKIDGIETVTSSYETINTIINQIEKEYDEKQT